MELMLAQDDPEDYVVGTGVTHTVAELVERAFGAVGLTWQDHVVCDAAFIRPAEVDQLCADATKARQRLGWKPEIKFDELVTNTVESDLAGRCRRLAGGRMSPSDRTCGSGSTHGAADGVADPVGDRGGRGAQSSWRAAPRMNGRPVIRATMPPPRMAATAARPSARMSELAPSR